MDGYRSKINAIASEYCELFNDDRAQQLTRQERGYMLERLIHGLLDAEGLEPRFGFKPKGDQLDGSFVYRERFFLIEAKWTSEALAASALYALRGKVDGKLVGTVGVFLSMSRYTKDGCVAIPSSQVATLPTQTYAK